MSANQQRALAPGGGIITVDPNPFLTPQASWTQTDWYIDPVNGSDSNSGADQNHPVKTVMGGVVARWGTLTPVLPQTTTLHLMGSETLGQESIVLTPILVGASGPSEFQIDGTLGMMKAAPQFAAGTVTSKARGAPGQLLTVAGMPGAAAVGMLVQNLTHGSYAFIDGLAAGVATMTQPLDVSGTIANNQTPANEVDTWAAGDQLQLWNLPVLNLKHFAPIGGDANTAGGGVFPAAVLQNFTIPDASGTPGYSTVNFAPVGTGLVAFNLRIDAFLNFMGAGQDINAGCYNCWIDGGTQGMFCGFTGGATCTGNVLGVGNGLGFTRLEDIASLDGDIIVHGEILIKGGAYDIIGTCYVADASAGNGLGIIHGGVLLLEPSSAVSGTTVQVWGPGKLFLESPMSAVENLSGTTWATILTLAGGYTIDSSTTAAKYVAGAPGVFTDGITISPANLDTNNGLQNPRTGSRFCTN